MFRFIGYALRALASAGTPPQEKHMITLDSEAALETCLAASEENPVLILKHSTRCPISSSALQEVREYVEERDGEVPAAYINYVVENRDISNAIASHLGIRHESPQAFLVSGGAVVWHASHGGITAQAIAAASGKLGGFN